MAGKTKDREFRHPDVAAYLRGLTGEAAKRSLVIREPDGVCTEYWREGGRVRCREVGAGEASGGPAPELRALLAAAEATFGRSLPRMKAEPGGGRVPDPAPSRRRSATACWIPGRGAARPFWRRSTPSFRPRPARAAAGRWSGTAGSGKTFLARLGRAGVKRKYFRCRQCGGGHFPLDRALGLEDRSAAPGAESILADAASSESYEEAGCKLDNLAGVRVPKSTLRRRPGVGVRGAP